MITEWRRLDVEPYPSLGYRKVERWNFRLPNGNIAPFDIVIGGHIAIIFSLTINNQVIIAKQFRPGPRKVLHELPSGYVEPHETPEQAAPRELLEETGYSGKITYIGTTYKDAYASTTNHVFVATECVKVSESLTLDPNEFIEPLLLSLEAFRAILKTGQLTDVSEAYMALDHLGLL